MRYAIAFLALLAFSESAAAYSCSLVRQYKAEIVAMSDADRKTWIKRLGLTKKVVREARRCLRG